MPVSHIIIRRGNPIYANAEDAAGSLVIKNLVILPLTVDRVYEGLTAQGHCRVGTLFEVVYNDDGTETVMKQFGNDPGEPNGNGDDINFKLSTAGKTGTQSLILRYKQFAKESATRGSLGVGDYKN